MQELLPVLALLQEMQEPTPGPADVARLFAGLGLILTIFTSALLFTYWISKDE